ncbi:ATPase_AAA_core domain-containing protein [Fusarium acuminatum]|uniref:ATPase_AAA_core domain-containing protein n=1 Tax=Fusarium acuminatum TaxID=5515 RepID=A0ABZ2WY27_9HYPO
MVDIYSLQAIPPQSTIFDDLQIDMNHKLIVQSLDLVRGKGSGLFILLHGVPGVGKTATAEAVAQANKKPLFTITCGDLGLTPEAVDSKLNEVFRLAHLWDSSPVLDERQFENVAVAIEQFGNYMDYTKAMTDADQARIDTLRADHMRNEDFTPRRRDYPRRREQAGYQHRDTSGLRDKPPRESMAGNTRREERRRARDQVPSARPTRHRDSGLGSQPEAPARSPRPRAPAGPSGGPSISGRASQRREQQPRYDSNDIYEEEDEFSDERDFEASDQKWRNRSGVGSREEEDYDDFSELTDGGARKDFSTAELDYDD